MTNQFEQIPQVTATQEALKNLPDQSSPIEDSPQPASHWSPALPGPSSSLLPKAPGLDRDSSPLSLAVLAALHQFPDLQNCYGVPNLQKAARVHQFLLHSAECLGQLRNLAFYDVLDQLPVTISAAARHL